VVEEDFSTLQMKAAVSSEIVPAYQTAQYHIPEDGTLTYNHALSYLSNSVFECCALKCCLLQYIS
jgi:hypothetical protein